mmetsp:Transcript_3217/g.3504  ORF Transcript_3217/g.3504 Transcript_3217/m.3504 type:complete len:102 (+) Transcript_3217:244-549(+)
MSRYFFLGRIVHNVSECSIEEHNQSIEGLHTHTIYVTPIPCHPFFLPILTTITATSGDSAVVSMLYLEITSLPGVRMMLSLTWNFSSKRNRQKSSSPFSFI